MVMKLNVFMRYTMLDNLTEFLWDKMMDFVAFEAWVDGTLIDPLPFFYFSDHRVLIEIGDRGNICLNGVCYLFC